MHAISHCLFYLITHSLIHFYTPLLNASVQVLPPNLVHLVVADCPKAAPLLALTQLQVLAMQASTMDAHNLRQVSRNDYFMQLAEVQRATSAATAAKGSSQHSGAPAPTDLVEPPFRM
jgi:hypothetical protein